jgi:hypothetical protein
MVSSIIWHTEKMNKQRVQEAIKDLGLKVGVADVVQRTGMPVLVVTAELNRIASESGGHLEVDSSGGVLYKFDQNFESRNLLRGSKSIVAKAFRTVYNAVTWAIRMFTIALFTLIRISFGIILILSVVVVVVAIIAVIVIFVLRILSMFSDSGGDAGGDLFTCDGFNFDFSWMDGFRFWAWDWTWDWCNWPGHYTSWDWDTSYSSSFYSYTPVVTNDTQLDERGKHDESRGDFLENCFTVLFGTGNPSRGLEDRRKQTLAQAIRAKCGVVVAEDLAPYAVTDRRDEDWMLPILVHYNGSPEVTESGKLVYVFPAFIPRTAPAINDHRRDEMSERSERISSASRTELDSIYSRFLQRQTAKTTAQNRSQTLSIAVTGVSGNELASVFFFAFIASAGALGLLFGAPNFILVQYLKPLLIAIAGYGSLFFILPALRAPFIAAANSAIERRNEKYVAAARKLASKHEDMERIQREAAEIRQQVITVPPVSLVYTTEEDSLTQAFTR